MPYYWTINKGACACCGACPPLYITLQSVQTSLTQLGTHWEAEWTSPTSSLNGIAVPAKYWVTALYVPFVKRASTNWFPQTSWSNWLCVVNGQIVINNDVISKQSQSYSNLWIDHVMTFVFVCDSSKFASAEAAFQADLATNIAKTMGVLTTL